MCLRCLEKFGEVFWKSCRKVRGAKRSAGILNRSAGKSENISVEAGMMIFVVLKLSRTESFKLVFCEI